MILNNGIISLYFMHWTLFAGVVVVVVVVVVAREHHTAPTATARNMLNNLKHRKYSTKCKVPLLLFASQPTPPSSPLQQSWIHWIYYNFTTSLELLLCTTGALPVPGAGCQLPVSARFVARMRELKIWYARIIAHICLSKGLRHKDVPDGRTDLMACRMTRLSGQTPGNAATK